MLLSISFGVTPEGHSIAVHVHNFPSYLWIACPLGFDYTNQTQLNALKNDLNKYLFTYTKFVNSKESLRFCYERDQKLTPHLKISTRLPILIRTLRTFFEEEPRTFTSLPFGSYFSQQVFEANIPYVLVYG